MQAQRVTALLAELHQEYLQRQKPAGLDTCFYSVGRKGASKIEVKRLCDVLQRTLQERVQVVLHELEGCAHIAKALALHSRSQQWIHSKHVSQS